MKKHNFLLIVLCCMVACCLVGCAPKSKVDYSIYNFVGVQWIRNTECDETLCFLPNGEFRYTCACGKTYTADNTPATGHKDSDGICTVCGQSTAVAMYGDANGDNAVTAMDVSLAAQYAAKKEVTLDFTAADVNGDNAVTAMDVSLIAQYAAKKIATFPVEGTN